MNYSFDSLKKQSQKQVPTYHSLMDNKMIIWRWKLTPATNVVLFCFVFYISECIYSIVGLTLLLTPMSS